MISIVREFTLADNKIVVDISGYEHLTVQVIGGSGTLSLLGTNNGGGVTGSTNDNVLDATDFTAVQAINLTTGATATAVTGTNLFRITPISFKYLQIGDGATAAATKVLVYCTKPY